MLFLYPFYCCSQRIKILANMLIPPLYKRISFQYGNSLSPKCCQDQGRTLKLATLPRITSDGPSGAVIQSSQMLCVSQDSQQKEEAAKFISWFENDPDCNNILQGERGIPVNATVRETLSANATEGQQIMYDFMDKVSKFKMPDKVNVLSPDGQDEVVDNYRNYIQQVVDGQITAEEAAQKTYDNAAALFTE